MPDLKAQHYCTFESITIFYLLLRSSTCSLVKPHCHGQMRIITENYFKRSHIVYLIIIGISKIKLLLLLIKTMITIILTTTTTIIINIIIIINKNNDRIIIITITMIK